MKAATKLTKWVDKQESRKRAAQSLDCTTDQLCKWMGGDIKPGKVARFIIDATVGIPHWMWWTKDECERFTAVTGHAVSTA
jgi:hypothetical protein